MEEVKAPNSYETAGKTVIFLAGSIEQGKATPWQKQIAEELKDFQNLVVLNPRRDDWDSSWVQSKMNPEFREQVTWELVGQEKSNIVAMYFDPETKSPITLLELGLFHKKVILFCPEGYCRKGNVDVTADFFKIEQANSWEEFMEKIRAAIVTAEDARLRVIWQE